MTRTRRLDLAEDALGEAFARASARWPDDGVPANPTGWLYATAHRHVLGRLRTETVAGRKAPLLAVRPGWVPAGDAVDVGDEADALADDRLQLILLCCHPALPPASRSAMALRLVIGTPTEQIARLFLVPTATMAARLTRAKKKIVLAGIPLGAPLAGALEPRLDAVLYDLVPDATQVRATLALLVLQHSRRDTCQRHGRLVTLADQDRALWRHDEIQVGLGLVARLEPAEGGAHEGYAAELRLQALIATEHARAPTAAATDWQKIAGHHADLEARTGFAIVRLNRAVAVAESEGPRAGLAVLAGLDEALRDNHRLAGVRLAGGARARPSHQRLRSSTGKWAARAGGPNGRRCDDLSA